MSQATPYGAVIYAKEYRALAAFYEGVAGFIQREADDEYILLEAPGFQLVILKIPEHITAAMMTDESTSKRETTPIKLFLNVRDLAQARDAAKSLGGQLNSVAKEWKFHGVTRCDGVDPEGNVFQLQEVG